jgi:DNA-binding LacI/PurR family transcriptional regulator
VVCSDSRLARSLIHAAVTRGLRVPADLSVVAKGYARDAVQGYPPLTCTEADFGKLNDEALNLLGQRIAGRASEPTTRLVSPRLVVRATAARVAE